MIRNPLPILTVALLLSGCETQRTVKTTQSRMSFGEQWSQQVGDVDKMKEKFAGGFEIRDGRAVTAGQPDSSRNKKDRRFGFGQDADGTVVKKVRTGPLADFRNQNEESVERFVGMKNFDTEQLDRNSFDAGDSPADSEKRSPWASRKSDLPTNYEAGRVQSSDKVFATESNRDAEKEYATSLSDDAGSRFDFRGNRTRERTEAYEQSSARRADAQVSIANPMDPGGSMTVDDVRRLLNPQNSKTP